MPLAARVPLIDWRNGFERHWNGGNPARTHIFNAMSLLFPDGERFFVEVAKEIASQPDFKADAELTASLRGFIAQESAHGHQHSLYNAVLEKQGYRNVSAELMEYLTQRSRRLFSPLSRLAIVCAYEHYTAVLGNFILSTPQALAGAPANLVLIWGWHAAEETEHKAVCFDLYRTVGGGWLRRVLLFLMVSFNFSRLFGQVYLHMLKRDGCLKLTNILSTAGHTLRFVLGRYGIAWHLLWHGLAYLSPGFHPWNVDNRGKLRDWLAANDARLRPVGA